MMRGFSSRKPKQQRQKERKPIPFQRVSAQIMIDSSKQIADSRVFLNDMSPTGLGCFTNVPIDKGEIVSISIEQPRHFFVKAEVMWCAHYSLSTKVLSTERFAYRVGVRFLFDSDEDRQAVKAFCEELYKKPA